MASLGKNSSTFNYNRFVALKRQCISVGLKKVKKHTPTLALLLYRQYRLAVKSHVACARENMPRQFQTCKQKLVCGMDEVIVVTCSLCSSP